MPGRRDFLLKEVPITELNNNLVSCTSLTKWSFFKLITLGVHVTILYNSSLVKRLLVKSRSPSCTACRNQSTRSLLLGVYVPLLHYRDITGVTLLLCMLTKFRSTPTEEEISYIKLVKYANLHQSCSIPAP